MQLKWFVILPLALPGLSCEGGAGEEVPAGAARRPPVGREERVLAGAEPERPAERPDRTEVTRGAAEKAVPPRVERAVAVLHPIGGSGVEGTVHFTKKGETVEVSGVVRGLEPGKHGFHVHEYGDLTDMETGESAGGHFAPRDMPHGRPEEPRRHAGDLGNIVAGEDGVARIAIEDSVLELNGPHSILGRAVVVHAGEDTFVQPSGGAGARVAAGIIGVAGPPPSGG